MSFCKKIGKDKIIFATQEDHQVPSKVTVAPIPEEERPKGLVLPNGDLNWSCPCLGSMPTGPCGFEFRDAVSCLHNSTADPKGSDCINIFRAMAKCMAKFPALYGETPKGAYEDPLDAAPMVPPTSIPETPTPSEP